MTLTEVREALDRLERLFFDLRNVWTRSTVQERKNILKEIVAVANELQRLNK